MSLVDAIPALRWDGGELPNRPSPTPRQRRSCAESRPRLAPRRLAATPTPTRTFESKVAPEVLAFGCVVAGNSRLRCSLFRTLRDGTQFKYRCRRQLVLFKLLRHLFRILEPSGCGQGHGIGASRIPQFFKTWTIHNPYIRMGSLLYMQTQLRLADIGLGEGLRRLCR